MQSKLEWDQFKELNDEQRLFLFYEALVDASEVKDRVDGLEKQLQSLNHTISGDPNIKDNNVGLVQRIQKIEQIKEDKNSFASSIIKNTWAFVGGVIGGLIGAFSIFKMID